MRPICIPPELHEGPWVASLLKQVTLESVLAYKDRDAVVWFLLLIVRNAGMLPSSYRVVPTAIVLGLWGSWILIIKLSTTPDFQDFYAALRQ